MSLANQFIKYPLLILYIAVQTFFLGLLLVWTLPLFGIAWPYSVILKYTFGAILSTLLAYFLFKKWSASSGKKIAVASALLLTTGVLSVIIVLHLQYQAKIRATEIMNLRDTR